MTLLQLEYFTVLSKIMHYAKAAEMLHITQPNLSYAISELEKELGVKLFERNGRGVRLTQHGLHFSHYARESLNMLEKGREVMGQLNASDEPISIAFIDEVGYDFLPDLIRGFHSAYPSVPVTLYQNHNSVIVPRLISGEYDIAFSIECANHPELGSVPIVSQEMMLFVPPEHRLENRSSVSLSDIGLDPVIMLKKTTGIRKIVDDMCNEAHVTLNVLAEAEECNAAAAYVGSGLAVCILPRTALHTKYHAVAVPIAYPSRRRNICLLYAKTALAKPTTRKFRDHVLSIFPEIQA